MIELNDSWKNKEEVRIRRVPVETLLDILHRLYDGGIDFVDFHGKIGEDEDLLGISFREEYVDPEYADLYEELPKEELSENNIKVKLSDDDINQLM